MTGASAITTQLPVMPHKFTGKDRDVESGLDFFIARYYASNLGRFTSPDEFAGGPVSAYSSNDPAPPGPLPYAEISDPQSLNKYTYTYNNPLNYTDPDGHDGCYLGCLGPFVITPQFLSGANELWKSLVNNLVIAPTNLSIKINSLGPNPPQIPKLEVKSETAELTAAALSMVIPGQREGIALAKGLVAAERVTAGVAVKLEEAVSKGVITGGGAQGAQEALEHATTLRSLGQDLKNLEGKLAKASGKKAREEVLKDIQKVIKAIKGHVKEVSQKWGKNLE